MSDGERDGFLNNDTFCMLPWTHMHIWPSGDTYPCCLGDSRMPVGSTQKNTMQEIWNNNKMKTLRNNMLEGKKSPECRRCYEQEEHGIVTLRKSSNMNLKHHWWKVEETQPDGSAGMVNMAYLDIRFSNLCNLRCRSCGPNFSTSWYDDHVKLYGDPGIPQLLKVADDMDKFFKDLEPMLLDVESVYFAGGEPIITEEHYRVLEYWLRHNMTDVRLSYTTNFTQMKFKKTPIFEYWNKFDTVDVAASLDANHLRGEYLRKNLDWGTIVQNRKDMIKYSPDVNFWITPTVSLYNAMNLPDFHKEWIEEGLIRPEHFRINPLLDPVFMRIQCLPLGIKHKVRTKYLDHITYLKGISNKCDKVIDDFNALISYMDEQSRTDQLFKFFGETDKLDNLRNEKFADVFPEYGKLRAQHLALDILKNSG
jgi:radical SAM protein with 4Fe4S-binding SPASM domain|tara:strand:+ start:2039 stop:3304 length:1266 start_codon:yes stop_codon:yes gene_type:complete